jgi:hypothetical protein
MKHIILLAILGLATICNAQKLHRHEITIGYYGGYFFDEIPFRVQNLRVNKRIPTITYMYHINKSFNMSVFYGIHDLAGERIRGIDIINKVIGRNTRHYALNGGYILKLKTLNMNFSTGLNYRTGYKGKFLYLYNHGTWVEGYTEYKDYKDLGLSVGVSLQHPIIRRFFGELTMSYVRYFSDFDKNLLMPGYRIGFRF